ncbi:MAG: hypothetical protein HY097_09035 [Nitrospinae bacterium]|nr:hypothetical protein [Nitrospinota bacterium]
MDNKKRLIDLICKGYCKFYKESKDEELSCEGFKFFERFFPPRLSNSDIKYSPSVFKYDSILMDILCKKCDFLIGGCDYRDEEHLSSAPPCGGFILLHRIMEEENNVKCKVIN